MHENHCLLTLSKLELSRGILVSETHSKLELFQFMLFFQSSTEHEHILPKWNCASFKTRARRLFRTRLSSSSHTLLHANLFFYVKVLTYSKLEIVRVVLINLLKILSYSKLELARINLINLLLRTNLFFHMKTTINSKLENESLSYTHQSATLKTTLRVDLFFWIHSSTRKTFTLNQSICCQSRQANFELTFTIACFNTNLAIHAFYSFCTLCSLST